MIILVDGVKVEVQKIGKPEVYDIFIDNQSCGSVPNASDVLGKAREAIRKRNFLTK